MVKFLAKKFGEELIAQKALKTVLGSRLERVGGEAIPSYILSKSRSSSKAGSNDLRTIRFGWNTRFGMIHNLGESG